MSSEFCDQHPGEQKRLYCYDCEVVLCHFCHVTMHNRHDLTDINILLQQFREQLADDVKNLSVSVLKKLDTLHEINNAATKFREKVSIVQSQIRSQYNHFVEPHKSELTSDLDSFSSPIFTNIEATISEISNQYEMTKACLVECQEMLNKRQTACDISRIHALHARAEELLKTQDEPDCSRLNAIEITLKVDFKTTANGLNFIGEIIPSQTPSTMPILGTVSLLESFNNCSILK